MFHQESLTNLLSRRCNANTTEISVYRFSKSFILEGKMLDIINESITICFALNCHESQIFMLSVWL